MKNQFFIVAFFFCMILQSCNSQKNTRKETYNKPINIHIDKINRPGFSKSMPYTEYKGLITKEIVGEDNVYHYNHDTIRHEISISNKYYSDFTPLFEKGILHPNLIGCFQGTNLSVGQFEELSKTSDETKRRYKFWRWCEGVANPCEYVIELSNKNATNKTLTKDFIENAILASLSTCSIII